MWLSPPAPESKPGTWSLVLRLWAWLARALVSVHLEHFIQSLLVVSPSLDISAHLFEALQFKIARRQPQIPRALNFKIARRQPRAKYLTAIFKNMYLGPGWLLVSPRYLSRPSPNFMNFPTLPVTGVTGDRIRVTCRGLRLGMC